MSLLFPTLCLERPNSTLCAPASPRLTWACRCASRAGSSINRTLGENATIEQVLEAAMHKAGLISDQNFGSFSKIRWTRASRTDKGVHSLGTVGPAPGRAGVHAPAGADDAMHVCGLNWSASGE